VIFLWLIVREEGLAMARLLEYQAKTLLKRAGIEVPSGIIAYSLPDAIEAAETFDYPVMVKAQLPVGSRMLK
jgi:succinyl-CoA synthetase beta subunit